MVHLVVGASGQVGGYLMRVLQEAGQKAIGTYGRDAQPGLIPLEMRDEREIVSALNQFKPNVVYVPACNPNVEWIEEHPREAHEINVKATLQVIRAASSRGLKTVFYSSDYVFDGRNGPYAEDAPTHPLNVYGQHKLMVEQEISAMTRDALILRTAVVFGYERQRKNFVYTMKRLLGGGQAMRIPSDQISSPTYAKSLASYTVKLVLEGQSGIFNVVGADILSRYDFAVIAARMFGWDPGFIQPVTTDQLAQKAKRPLRAGLITKKLVDTTGLIPLSAETALRRTREEFEVSKR